MTSLFMPWEVDRLFRYPRGRSERLARKGKLPHIVLPDGEIRFPKDRIESMVTIIEPSTQAEEAHASH